MSEISGIVRTLGGEALLHARTAEQLRAALRGGLPFASLAAVASGFSLEPPDVVSILHIPPRTLARRKK
jgi:hypothetical protein